MPSKVFSTAISGLDAKLIEVEIDITPGLHCFNIVGLPDKAVEESKERIKSAIKNCQAEPPQKGNKKIIINLAPANIKKEGPCYDVPIALAYLLESNQTSFKTDDKIFVGELALNGNIRPVNGVLSSVLLAKELNFKEIFVPKQNAEEANMVKGIRTIGVESVNQLLYHLEGKKIIPETTKKEMRANPIYETDMMFIKGQEHAKRALEIAAAGGHNILMIGPPGTGKTLLAKAVPSILPALAPEESLEVTKIWSVAGQLTKDRSIIKQRPFRAPHHSASYAALVGGGTYPKPGEITLSHRGVLFLDEFAEFSKSVLESLRQPLEDGKITISRARSSMTFPAKFMLVAATNPCPCGFLNDPNKDCACSAAEINKYKRKVSGPILDRIDLHIEIPRIKYGKLSAYDAAEKSSSIRKRVDQARNTQRKRYKGLGISTNSELGPKHMKKHCQINKTSKALLKQAADKLNLSARSYFKVIKLARTIADLDNCQGIQTNHIAEALQYRFKNE